MILVHYLVACLLLAVGWGQDYSLPEFKYSSFGGKIGFFGSFSGVSFYNYDNASSFLDSSSNNDNIYVRTPSSNKNVKVGYTDGTVTQISQYGDHKVLINGDFSLINGVTHLPPIVFDYKSNEVSSLFPKSKRDSVDGTVSTMLVVDDLVYLGGNFSYNGTYGAAIYNKTSELLQNLPFKGFGKNGSVSAITYLEDGDEGLIIFGGEFDTLGISNLLIHNSTNSSTNTNMSLITAEQMVSLRHGTFSNVNGAGDDSSLICPGTDWSLESDSGGEWAVELPDEMKGVTPTKARLYVPSGDDAVKLFRIYSYPNNGIMNLSYIDPESNERAYCDAWCPLLNQTLLETYTKRNAKHEEGLSTDSTFVDDNGSYATYYDDDDHTKTLGYASDYQEFSFENEVALDKVGITVLSWYGSKGVLSGFELYSNSIMVYGNETLNEPNCDSDDGDDDTTNYSVENSGKWQRVTDLVDVDTDYLVSVVSSDSSITLYPNISYSGNYSILLSTPGCSADDSCDKRSIVNVTVIDNDDNVLSTNLIYQNNENDKFDYLFYGHLNGSADYDGHNKVQISYHESILDVSDPWVVVDKVTANIVSLDSYYDKHSNKTKKGSVDYIYLNGLFEYSLGNFSDFDESHVSTEVNNKTVISSKNTYVGNSTINELSGRLDDSSVSQIVHSGSQLVILGDFSSDSLDVSDVITLKVSGYNETSNETEMSIEKRGFVEIAKRDSDYTIFGAEFNNSVSIANINNQLVFTGEFSVSNTSITDLATDKSVDTANNFAVYSGEWSSFGNLYLDIDFDKVTNITIGDTDLIIFSSLDEYRVWDNSSMQWGSHYDVNISLAVNMSEQVIAGKSFGIMDFYSDDQAIVDDEEFSKYDFSVDGDIVTSYFINDSVSVVGGKFTGDAQNVGFIDNTSKNKSMTSLDGIEWGDSVVQALYVNSDYLFIGFNGSVVVSKQNLSGVIIYDLKKSEFTSFQPAQLSGTRISSMVYKSDKLLVGGDFTLAGSLDCSGLCLYDIKNTRWMNPDSDSSLDGDATDMKFYKSNKVVVSGNFSLNGDDASFITYDFDKSSFGKVPSSFDISKTVKRFVMNDNDESDLSGRFAAFGDDFVAGYNGKKWSNIDSGIDITSNTRFTDLKLLATKNKESKDTYFDSDQLLALSGVFNLTDFGPVNVALYNGTNWIPYVFASSNSSVGQVSSILIKDSYLFLTSKDASVKHLAKGKVVGISLACALGATTLVGLIYLIPFFALFKKREKAPASRAGEKDMMAAVNPEDLIHEIDMQRNH